MSPFDATAQTLTGQSQLSQRQLNQMKRKNKHGHGGSRKIQVLPDFTVSRRESTGPSQTPAAPEPTKNEIKREDSNGTATDYFSLDRQNGDDNSKVVSEFKGPVVPEKSTFQTEAEEKGLEWPYERLCEFLTVDLFDLNWQIRHGAAMGLREIVRVHGAGAGREHGKTRAQNDLLNERWMNDLACRLCCVFMLDRFGDYVSDNVVAPIRETAGQALGALLQHAPPNLVRATYRILYRLVMQEDPKSDTRSWQACHGGMIGMRYLVAVRNDLLLQDNVFMDGVLEVVMKGLGDWDDDVRAVSAATLIPVAKEMVGLRPAALRSLITIVWDCLSNLSDDLSASTGSVMDLLAKLCSFPEVLEAMKQNAAKDQEHSFTELVPRLYPFLRHTITSVRSAILRALLTFLNIAGKDTKGWVTGKTLRLIYQNLLVERNEGVLKLSLQVWNALLDVLILYGHERFAAEFVPHVDALFTLTVHPIGVPRHPLPMDPTLFIRPSGQTYAPFSNGSRRISPVSGPDPAVKKRRRSEKKDKDMPPPSTSSHNIDGAVMQGDVDLVGADILTRSRIYAATAFGRVIAMWPSAQRSTMFGPKLLSHLQSTHSTTQLFASMIAEEFARSVEEKDGMAQALASALRLMVESESPPCYSDLVSYLQIVRAQCQSLVSTFWDVAHSAKLPIIAVVVQGEPEASQYAFSITDGEKLVGPEFERLKKSLTPAQRVAATKLLDDARLDAWRAIDEAKEVKEIRDVRIKAAAAAGLVALKEIPKKPVATIRGMMDSVKKEDNPELQRRSAAAVADLVGQLVAADRSSIANKVVRNLIKFCCSDTAETPEFHFFTEFEESIISLKKDEDVRRTDMDPALFEKQVQEARITRRGAKEALEQLCQSFGSELLERLPILRTLTESPIQEVFGGELPSSITNPDDTLGQDAIDALSTIRALMPSFHPDIYPFVLNLLPLIAKALQSRLSVLRYAAAKCFATICSVTTAQGMTMLVEKVLPPITNAHDVRCRQGATECIYHLIHVMEDAILPYVIFLITPVLGRMSDANSDVRLIATTTFATLVKLVPLEAGIPDPPGLPEELLKGRDRERKFVAQMLDVKKVEPFEIPVAIKAELRSYQQDGVNWLAFLNRYNLHGILCDDMGLGKTLQTLCIVASDHHTRAEEFCKTQDPEKRRLPSLI
ncbi:hypothetical protein B0A49_13996, partial [Cryomyces minteri]